MYITTDIFIPAVSRSVKLISFCHEAVAMIVWNARCAVGKAVVLEKTWRHCRET